MKLPAVDVLRGIAALGVAWYHSRVDLWVGFKAIQADPANFSVFDRALSWLSLPVSQMGSMVMLFFVLSGFCIHLPAAGKNRMPGWWAYAARRFFRIYPAYLATVGFCLVGAWGLHVAAGGVFPDPGLYAATAAMLQNWIFDGRQIGMNPSLWSIPVEAELYLVYPLLLWISLRLGFRAALLFTLACTAYGASLFFFGWGNSYGTFFKYAVIWNSGAWLAERFVRGTLPRWTLWHAVAMLGVFGCSMLAGLAGADVFYLHYGWAFSSFLLLWWALGPGARFFAPTAWWVRMLVFFGTVSYSIYLLHFPLFRLAGAAWFSAFGSKPESFLVPTLGTLLVVPVAWIFYRLVEHPSHELGRRTARTLEGRPA